jgi:hypothetical protein
VDWFCPTKVILKKEFKRAACELRKNVLKVYNIMLDKDIQACTFWT